jgi:hypothetical protein
MVGCSHMYQSGSCKQILNLRRELLEAMEPEK